MVIATGSSQRHIATMARASAGAAQGGRAQGLELRRRRAVGLGPDRCRRRHRPSVQGRASAASTTSRSSGARRCPRRLRWPGCTPERAAPRGSAAAAVRVTIAAVGRERTGPARELFEDYRRRSRLADRAGRGRAAERPAARAPPRRGGPAAAAGRAARARSRSRSTSMAGSSTAWRSRAGSAAWRDQGAERARLPDRRAGRARAGVLESARRRSSRSAR